MVRILACSEAEGTKEIPAADLQSVLKEEGTLVWVDIEDPSEADLGILSSVFGFHPLAIEDTQSRFHLPKLNDYGEYVFIIWHGIQDIPDTRRVETAEVDIFLGEQYLVTCHVKQMDDIDLLRADCLKKPGLIGLGVDRLLHSILDRLVDDYFAIVDRMSNQIDGLEDQIFRQASEEQVKQLFTLKHQMLFLRKLVAPERDVANMLSRYESKVVRGQLRIFFQDIFDHLARILDLIDTSRDVIGGAMDIYLSTVSNRLNEVMKKLTIVATIFMPLNLVAGVYGMNFKYMPELQIPFFYHGVLFSMAIFAVSAFAYFKWKKWW